LTTSQRSYYEIALTNRQVLIAFSILLGCVISAFVSGLWVGRQAAARTLAGAEVVRPGDSAEPGTYRFFGEDATGAGEESAEAPTAGVVPSPAPPPQAIPPQPSATQPAAAQPAEERTPIAEPAVTKRVEPETAPATAEPPPREAPSRQADAALGAPSSPTEEASEPEPERKHVVDPPATSELSVIQVFSTADEAQARSVLDRLKSGGFRAFLSPVQVDGRTMYRVRVGPFRERAAAEEEAATLKQLYKLDTWITN